MLTGNWSHENQAVLGKRYKQWGDLIRLISPTFPVKKWASNNFWKYFFKEKNVLFLLKLTIYARYMVEIFADFYNILLKIVRRTWRKVFAFNFCVYSTLRFLSFQKNCLLFSPCNSLFHLMSFWCFHSFSNSFHFLQVRIRFEFAYRIYTNVISCHPLLTITGLQ